jgi:galactokinase
VTAERTVQAPGRVNLIGDHTDYTGGLVFPMAIDLALTMLVHDSPGVVDLCSDTLEGRVVFSLPVAGEPSRVVPAWGAFVAAVAAELPAPRGATGTIRSTIPSGAGLSSSAALECATALALGFDGNPVELALLAQRAERTATGVPTGIMDQLCIASAIDGHATLIDCHSLHVEHVPVPDEIDVVVKFVSHRTLVGSAYADRVAECALAEVDIGPLRLADVDDLDAVTDDTARRRARHVVGENRRVRAFASALTAGDYEHAGRLMTQSHRSLRDDFDTSTPTMDAAVESWCATPGVFGARMTGGGFGGCVVAICTPGALDDGWIVRASSGVREL